MCLAGSGITVQYQVAPGLYEVQCLKCRKCLLRLLWQSVGIEFVEVSQLWKAGVFYTVAALVLGAVLLLPPQEFGGECPLTIVRRGPAV